jgi:UrcA family protein
MMKSPVYALAALGLAGAAITPALAGNTDRMTMTVSVADIDLATAKGQRTLDRRLEKAVRTVCRATDLTTGSRILSQESRVCVAKARASVKPQLAALSAKTSANRQRGG